MIDSHCHLDFSDFDDDRDTVLARCKNAGVSDIVVPGVAPEYWSKQLALCHQQPNLHPALGLHPWFLASLDDEQALSDLRQSIDSHHVVAIGETGLDFSQKGLEAADEERQYRLFKAHLELAMEYRLPIIVHHRKSHHRILQALKDTDFEGRGVIHAYSGSTQQAQAYIERGFYLGIGGTITYPRAKKTRQAVSALPLDSLLLETDAPDMPVCGRQGERHSPEFLPEIAQTLAGLKARPVDEITATTTANTKRLFQLNP